MEPIPGQQDKKRKILTVFLKISISLFCLWYVSGKIEFDKAGQLLKNSEWYFLSGAFIAFIISKLIAAFRLNIYFKNIGLQLGERQNLKLYWLGMFYNLFLPGSIGGDAYKVILLKKKYDAPYKKTTSAVLLDRFSGLLGLGIILAVYSYFILEPVFSFLITAGIITAFAGFYYIIKRWFSDFIPGFWLTLLLGVLVQAVQVFCIYMVMLSLNIIHNQTAFIFIFLVSSVVSVLPLTIGGLGIRELVFMEGASYFSLEIESSVVISLLFYLITLVVSAAGVWFIFNDPLKKERTPNESFTLKP
jgi:glycosyltransferase 2 family protein